MALFLTPLGPVKISPLEAERFAALSEVVQDYRSYPHRWADDKEMAERAERKLNLFIDDCDRVAQYKYGE